MSIPRTILPKLAGLSHMARSVLLVAYAVADEDGEARCIMSAGRSVHGQGRDEVRKSIAELVRADLVKYELQPLGRQRRGWVLTLLEWGP